MALSQSLRVAQSGGGGELGQFSQDLVNSPDIVLINGPDLSQPPCLRDMSTLSCMLPPCYCEMPNQ